MKTYFNEKVERIICPFDFTTTGRTGLEYGAVLSAALGARLTIFYVQPSIWPEELQLYEDMNDITRAVKRLIQLEAKDIEDRFGVKTNYIIEPTSETIELAVGAMSADYDLIVMGTNGADDLYQHVFGTNSHHVLGLAHCPVLTIPAGYQARIPRLVVFAVDPATNPAFLVGQLENFAKPFKTEVRTLTVAPDAGTREAEQKMELLGEMLGVKERKEFDWGFEPLYSDQVVLAVDDYMKVNGADVLALSFSHRALFEKLFQKNVMKQISRIADFPVLVFWH